MTNNEILAMPIVQNRICIKKRCKFTQIMQMSMQNNVFFDVKSAANMKEFAAYIAGNLIKIFNDIRCDFAHISCRISQKFAACFAGYLTSKYA